MSVRCRAVVVLILVGCGRVGREPPSGFALPRADPQAEVRVVLVWSAPADLDLYVTDAAFETVYFGNTPARSGGRLEADVRCPDVRRLSEARAPVYEATAWGQAPPGTYRVGVDFMNECGASSSRVPFRVLIDVRGVRQEATGTIRPGEFVPIVREFYVPPAGQPAVPGSAGTGPPERTR